MGYKSKISSGTKFAHPVPGVPPLRASLRLSKFAPGEFVGAPQGRSGNREWSRWPILPLSGLAKDGEPWAFRRSRMAKP